MKAVPQTHKHEEAAKNTQSWSFGLFCLSCLTLYRPELVPIDLCSHTDHFGFSCTRPRDFHSLFNLYYLFYFLSNYGENGQDRGTGRRKAKRLIITEDITQLNMCICAITLKWRLRIQVKMFCVRNVAVLWSWTIYHSEMVPSYATSCSPCLPFTIHALLVSARGSAAVGPLWGRPQTKASIQAHAICHDLLEMLSK